ncbi:MAG: YggT family protein [Candidatus Omnitrophica bacterium]|nr:YggT family protein [Candidatus Omnitrophota bacterium]
MFVLGNFVQAVAFIIDKVLELYNLVLIVAVLVSWVSPDPFNPVVRFLRSVSEPVFDWIRRRLPFVTVGMLDLSPIVAFMGIYFLRMFLVRTLFDLSVRLR